MWLRLLKGYWKMFECQSYAIQTFQLTFSWFNMQELFPVSRQWKLLYSILSFKTLLPHLFGVDYNFLDIKNQIFAIKCLYKFTSFSLIKRKYFLNIIFQIVIKSAFHSKKNKRNQHMQTRTQASKKENKES